MSNENKVVLPEPDGVGNLPYFSYDSDSGVEFHETEAEAIKACESALGYYREESPDGWPDEVESLKWGLVLGRSVQCDVQPIEDHPDFTETCDYQLKPYALLATATGLPAQAVEQPRLTVRLTSFPEFNGKRNWTAMFKRTGKFDGLIGNAGGITIARGECWNRVAYHAEEARFLLGERGTEPDIMAYGDDVHTPQEWSGEDADGVFAAIAAAKGE